MSFTSKNLHSTRGGMGFIKWATLFFLGMSCVFFMARAFDVETNLNAARTYLKEMVLTVDGTNLWSTGIALDGILGNGYFAGKVETSQLCLNGDCKVAWPVWGWSSVWSTGGSNTIYYNAWNVGIGTNTPTAKLDILSGSTKISLNSDYLNAYINLNAGYPTRSGVRIWQFNIFGGPLWYIWSINSPLLLSAWNNLNDGLILTTWWNVGIGTNPTAKLEVNGNVSLSAGASRTINVGPNRGWYGNDLNIAPWAGDYGWDVHIDGWYSDVGPEMGNVIVTQPWIDWWFVGIWTSTPIAKLQVEGTFIVWNNTNIVDWTNSVAIWQNNNINWYSDSMAIGRNINIGAINSLAVWKYNIWFANTLFEIGNWTGVGDENNIMTVTMSWVGIGSLTSRPVETLEVVGGVKVGTTALSGYGTHQLWYLFATNWTLHPSNNWWLSACWCNSNSDGWYSCNPLILHTWVLWCYDYDETEDNYIRYQQLQTTLYSCNNAWTITYINWNFWWCISSNVGIYSIAVNYWTKLNNGAY